MTSIWFTERENEYGREQETMTCSPDTYNAWKALYQDPIMQITPRFGHAAAPFRIQSPNSSEAGDSNLLLVIHGGIYIAKELEIPVGVLSNTTDFFDIDTETWISPEVEVGNVTDLAIAHHTAVSFVHLPGSPVVIYGGTLNPGARTLECVSNVRILMSDLRVRESQNRLVWKEGKPGPPRCCHAAAAVGSDMVVFGGSGSINIYYDTGPKPPNFESPTSDIYIYSPINNTWARLKPQGPIPAPRLLSAIVAMDDECIIIVGGAAFTLGMKIQMTDVYLYNVSSNRWTFISELPSPAVLGRTNFHAFLSKSGHSRSLLTMQLRRFEGNRYMVYRFNLTKPSDGKWTYANTEVNNPHPKDRMAFSLTTVNFKGRDRAYLFGGLLKMKISSSMISLPTQVLSDLSYLTGTSTCYFWTDVSPLARSPGAVYGHTVTLLHNSIFVFGGYIQETLKGGRETVPDVWRIDPGMTSRTWQQYRSLLHNKKTVFGHSTVAISQVSCLLTYGGLTRDEYNRVNTGDVLLVCPHRFTWRQFPYVKELAPPGRIFHTAVVYKDKMYVYGGIDSTETRTNSVLDDLWYLHIDSILNNTAGGIVAWKQLNPTTESPSARFGHSALAIKNNSDHEMIVFGGTDGQAVFDEVWIYSYFLNEWKRLKTSTSSLRNPDATVARFGHAAIVVGNQLIVHGGCTLPPHTIALFSLWQPLPSCSSAGRSSITMYLDLITKTWRVLETTHSIPLLFHKAVLVSNEIIIYGGLKANNLTSDELLVLRPSCNPGMWGSMADTGCSDCPIGTYSENSCPEYQLCSNFFTTNQTGSRFYNNCNICYGICSNGGSCVVTRPNVGYECSCPVLFTGPTCGNVGPALGLASGITGGLILLYLIVRLVRYFRRVKEDAQTIQERDAYIGDFIEGGRIAERELTFGRSLGMGAFGEVMLAEYREIQVAVKILHHGPNRPIMGSDTSQLFEQEIDFMRRTRHENIVLFLGWGVASTGGLFLVTEYLRRGSLNSVLQTYRDSLTLERRVQFARDSAEGMRYLHTKGRIHRDLKSANLLVGGNWMVKVADFGSARTLFNLEAARDADYREYHVNDDNSDDYEETALLTTNYVSMTRRVGTLLYSAPEVIARQAYGAAIDVYRSGDKFRRNKEERLFFLFSFGIVMWEIYTRRTPFEDQELPQHYDDFVDMICEQQVRPVIPVDCPSQWRDLMKQCWSGDSCVRPLFREIVKRLDEFRAEL